jgi:hypothetical protein
LLLLVEDFDHLTYNLLLISVLQRQYNLTFTHMNLRSGQEAEVSFVTALEHAQRHFLLAVNCSMQNGLPGMMLRPGYDVDCVLRRTALNIMPCANSA